MNFNKILVPIDFSEDSYSAYQVALDHFSGSDKTLVLLHVVERSSDVTEQEQQNNVNRVREVKRNLNTLGNSHRDAWKEVTTLIETGKPTDIIISTAKQEHSDLVVMGSHGKGGLTKALFGSTTYDVARKITCSVMITKAKK